MDLIPSRKWDRWEAVALCRRAANRSVAASGRPMLSIQSAETIFRGNLRCACRWWFALLGTAIAAALQPACALNVSVADFGAAGDNVRDDTAAIQRALDAVRQAGSGEVFFPRGTYSVSVAAQGASLNVGSRVTLRGQSAQQSVLRLNVQGRFDTLLRPDAGAVQMTVQDLDVINNRIRSVNIGTPPLEFSSLHNGIRFQVHGEPAPGSHIRILGNRIENSPAAGIYFDQPLHGVLVSGNTVINPGSSQGGLPVGAARGIRVAGQTRDFHIFDNAFVDDRPAPRMSGGIYEISNNLGNCSYGSNKVQLASGAAAPQFTSGPSHAGPPWIANPPPFRHDAFDGADPNGWTPVSLHNGIQFDGILGQSYRVEYRDATNLPWSVLEEVSPLHASPATVFDPADPYSRGREYQVLEVAGPAVSSVSDGKILLSGQPCFPIGMYHVTPQNVTSTEVERRATTLTSIANATFNALALDDRGDAALAALLDSAASTPVRILLGGPEDTSGFLGTVSKYKHQKALCGWTLADDADNGRISLPSLADKNTKVKQADPARITSISLTGWNQARRSAVASYMSVCDVVRVQCYPIGRVDGGVSYGPPLKDNFQWLSEATAAAAPFKRPVIAELQAFSWGAVGSDTFRIPNPAEERNLTYGALAAGVKGILWFTAHEPRSGWTLFNDTTLWNELKTLKDDVSTMSPFLLNGSFTKNIPTGNPECVASRWQLENQEMIIVVNLNAQSDQNVQIDLPSGAANVRRLVARLRSSLSASDGRLIGALNAAEVQTYICDAK